MMIGGPEEWFTQMQQHVAACDKCTADTFCEEGLRLLDSSPQGIAIRIDMPLYGPEGE